LDNSAHLLHKGSSAALSKTEVSKMEEGLWIPILALVVIGAVSITVTYFRHKTRMGTEKTIRLALEKGNELSPEMLDRLANPKKGTGADLRRGMVSVAIGIGFALIGIMGDEDEMIRPLIGIAMLPMFIGFAYLILWRLGEREQKN
jgi:hypothetical protein